jgi:hypothetical protein
LVIASGQNLKRLLQKRGWGRRPFPTEAMALKAAAKRETQASFSTRTRTPLRRAVAVTFTTLFNSSTTCVPTRKGWFFSTSSQLFLACHKEEICRCVSVHLLFSGSSFFRRERAGHCFADPCSYPQIEFFNRLDRFSRQLNPRFRKQSNHLVVVAFSRK